MVKRLALRKKEMEAVIEREDRENQDMRRVKARNQDEEGDVKAQIE